MNLSEAYFLYILHHLIWGCQARLASVFDDRHPLIVSLPQGSNLRDHFGYDVDWIKENSNLVSLFVGAPRKTGGGGLFKCSVDWEIETKECLDLSPKNIGRQFDEDWNSQLLGLTVSAGRGDLWTCAPSFRRPYLKEWKSKNMSLNYSSMIGHCFVYKQAQSYQNPSRVLPLRDSSMFYGWKEFPVDYVYGALYAQAGMSIHRDGERVFLGAPGAWNWTGSIAAVNKDDLTSSTFYQPWSKWNPDTRQIEGPSLNDYSGYSIDSGAFFHGSSHKLIALGAPRHGKSRTGSVFIGNYAPGEEEVESRYQIDGDQMGEYFGGSLACMDLDGDGSDEIVIGSPLFNSRSSRRKRTSYNPLSYIFEIEEAYDSGRVSIFKFDKQYDRFIRIASISGQMSRGRFGSSLLNAGDLNGDGTEDLIVGSPYEDEGRGAIRIYLGNSKRIVNRDFVQTILARDMDYNLFGFGISFSRPLDIDDNSVKDIAVGSDGHKGERGKVVILRGQPTGYVKLYIYPSVDEIDFSSTKDFELKVCVELKSRIQSDVNFISKAKISIHGDRRSILNGEGSFWSSEFIRIEQNLKKCFPSIKVNLSPSFKPSPDADPLRFNILAETKEWDVFCSNCGITEPSREELEIPFIMGCYVDDGGAMRCRTDLSLRSSIKEINSKETYIIGSTKKITLLTEVANRDNMDPAFQPMIVIIYPKELSLLRNLNECRNSKSLSKLVCLLTGPIRPGTKSLFEVEFDASKLIGDPMDEARSLVFPKISVLSRSSFSEDIDASNNDDVLQIPLAFEADFHIFVEDEGKVTNSSAYFNTFQIKKRLVSPMKGVQTQFLIPVSDVEGNQFVFDELFSIQSSSVEKVPCDNKILLQAKVDGKEIENPISCQSKGIRCLKVKCPPIIIRSPEEIAQVSLRFSFDKKRIREITGQDYPNSLIHIDIEGSVNNGHLSPELNSSPDSVTMKARLTPINSYKTSHLLLIIGSSLTCSLLIILIILYVLYKLKVFKRKTFAEEEEDELMMMHGNVVDTGTKASDCKYDDDGLG